MMMKADRHSDDIIILYIVRLTNTHTDYERMLLKHAERPYMAEAMLIIVEVESWSFFNKGSGLKP
jgi:hypothetical protein